jgi:Secretion system C-terminal sorting domain
MNISTTFSKLFFLLVAFNFISSTAMNAATTFDNKTKLTTVDVIPSFYITGKDVCVDETLIVPIKVSDFVMITSFQFTIGWDNTLMSFDTISFKSPALGSTLLFNDMSSDNGILTISWYDQNVQGVTLDDFMDIFKIEFTVVADNQTNIAVTFENEPTMKEVSGFVGNDIVVIDATYVEGEVNIDQQELDSYEIITDVNNSNAGGVNITVINGTTPYEYTWSNDSESQNLSNVGVGDYMVTVTDAKGCVSTFGEFTVDNTVAVKEINSLQSISLYPNPATDQFHLNAVFEKTEVLEIELYNILGEKVFVDQREAANLDMDLNISNLSNGTYFLQLKTFEGFHTEKLEIIR